jgi:hypothetical protein
MDRPKTIYYTGILTLSSLSILGLIYISKTVYSRKCRSSKIENNISRMTIVLLWALILWVIFGSVIQQIWFTNIFI